MVHGVRLERGWWVCNLHAQAHSEARAQADVALRRDDGDRVVGGRARSCSAATSTRAIRWRRASSSSPATASTTSSRDGCAPAGPGRTLERGRLSDHAPVLADVA